MVRRVTPIGVRLWRKVERRGPDECWPWTGGTIRKGYGQMGAGRWDEGTRLCHRVAYEDAYGPIPAGGHVLHHCDNPPCCNPAHLFLGTNADNVTDMYAKGRGNRGSRNGNAKLNSDLVLEIRERHASGEAPAALARAMGVHLSTLCDVLARRTWRHVV